MEEISIRAVKKTNEFFEGLKELQARTGVWISNEMELRVTFEGHGAVKEKPKLKYKRKSKKLNPRNDNRVPIDGSKVKKRAEELGLSMSEIGRRIGIGHKSLLNHYVTGRYDPSEDYFLELVKVLDVKPANIVGTHLNGQAKSAGKLYEGKYAKRKGGKIVKPKKVKKKYKKK